MVVRLCLMFASVYILWVSYSSLVTSWDYMFVVTLFQFHHTWITCWEDVFGFKSSSITIMIIYLNIAYFKIFFGSSSPPMENRLTSMWHDEGTKILDIFEWTNNTAAVDKLWLQLKRSLREVPIVKRKSYGTSMMFLMPPRVCELKELQKRCTKCFYYKEMEKFLQLVYRG